MAFTITRYRASNPGTGSRGFDITAVDGDTTLLLYTFFPRTPWVPDSWTFQSTDNSGCLYLGEWRGALSTITTPNDTFTVTKGVGVGSGGAVRLTLQHLCTRS